jgi:hypothetical protein
MPKTIRVRSSEGAKLLARDSRGNLIPGRYVGRDRSGAVVAGGVLVEQTSDVLRAVQRGDLVLVPDAPAQAETPEETDR